MTSREAERPNVKQILDTLKDFQRDTVEYVFRRLYLDQPPVSRFLIADEVGLGKTLVARGLIAQAVDHLWDTVERIDVLYICSNQEIARQNIDRLNITKNRTFQHATRSTLLPITLQQLKDSKLNFVSFTPGTSFHLHSSSGVVKERWVLYRLLLEHWDLHEPTCRNVLRAGVQKGNFRRYIAAFDREEIDADLQEAFNKELDRRPELRREYEQIAEAIGYRRSLIPYEMRAARDAWIGKMRRLLARSSLGALEPDLVILDEFQRFKYLLEEDSPVALLAREVFEFPKVKVLLLSATPYKMYSLAWELEDDHHEDFFRTARFLMKDDPQALERLREGIQEYRQAYLDIDDGPDQRLKQAKANIEAVLRKIMVRTERLAASQDRNGMLEESQVGERTLSPRDFLAFRHFDHITRELGSGDMIEFWKSTAFPLNLMDGYKVKASLKSAIEDGGESSLKQLLNHAQGHLLHWKDIRTYQEVDPENARLRALFRYSLDTENWKLLWLPPSLPYYQPVRPFKDIGPDGFTKSLVFSAWRVVPKAIAVLASYEAERRTLSMAPRDFTYEELTRKRRPLLNFSRTRGRLAGMPIFCLTFPSWTMATEIDPLCIARGLGEGRTPSQSAVFRAARAKVKDLLEAAIADWPTEESDRPDDRWYWAGLGMIEWCNQRPLLKAWFGAKDPWLQWDHMLAEDPEEEKETGYVEHVHRFREFLENREPLGRPPRDLLDVLVRVALAGPATAALRAMLRVSPSGALSDSLALMAEAARVGLAFRTFFNQPLSISVVNQAYKSGAYWKKVLRYAQAGNLQSVLDEYLHVLNESLGLMEHKPAERAKKLAEALSTALSLRTPSLAFDEIVRDTGERYKLKQWRIRCRYALRFGDEKGSGIDERTRSSDVRTAFNSPFRPFILATTSIGQEGLDFHQYCHRVVHWNLPSNPVDLEQREGRVHRYKGHVIRRNLAKRYGLRAVDVSSRGLVDPWQQLFERACCDRPEGANELYPYWVFDIKGGYKIERQIPLLPLSREVGQLAWLKKTLVAYRSVIGQPRQQELTEFLARRFTEEELVNFTRAYAIDLSPPPISGS